MRKDLQKIKDFEDSGAHVFTILESFHIAQIFPIDEAPEIELTLAFRTEFRPTERLTLTLKNVHDLSFTLPPATLIRLYALQITSLFERQLQNIAYEVTETEHKAFALYCKDFSFSIAEVAPEDTLRFILPDKSHLGSFESK